jgi:multiple sugar transport system substrate-binding protein
LDRLLFYVSLAVLVIALPIVFWQFPQDIPFLGEERRVLVFTQWWQNELDAEILSSLIREFEAQNPGIWINLDTRPYHEVRRLLLSESPNSGEGEVLAAGQKADILSLDPRWFPALMERDLLEPDTSVLGKDSLLRMEDDEVQSAAPGALPIVSCVIPLFYRIDLLQEAGFDRPPKNHAEFTEMARAITGGSQGRYGFAISLSPEDPLGVYRDILPWFRSSGATFLRDGQPVFTEKPAGDTLYFLKALSQEGILAPESFTKTNKDRVEDFKAGRLAMMLAPAVEISNLRAAGIPFGVTSVPIHASYIGKPVAGIIGWYAGIPRSGRYKDEARSFLAFLSGKAGDIAGKTGMVPGTSVIPEAGSEPSREQDAIYLKVRDIYVAASTTEEYLSLPEEMMLETILVEELRLMLEEDRSPDETALAVQKKWEAALGLAQE